MANVKDTMIRSTAGSNTDKFPKGKRKVQPKRKKYGGKATAKARKLDAMKKAAGRAARTKAERMAKLAGKAPRMIADSAKGLVKGRKKLTPAQMRKKRENIRKMGKR